jgi:glycosyltransferase involved in cell wall biosynthesis
MKILHVITRLILGGAQKNTVMSCAAQVQAGHEVHLAFGPIYGPEGSLLQDAEQAGAVTHMVPSMRRAVLPPHDLACYFALRRLIARLEPDVVHTHSSKAGIIGRGAAWAQRVPAIVHTIHGLPFHDRQSRAIHHAYVVAEKWAAKRCHRLIGITQAMCDAFAAKGIASPDKCCVIPSGIDLSAFEVDTPPRDVTRKAYGIPADAPVIGIVARLDPLKGHDDLLDALPSILARHPDTHVLFVGDGWHRETLEQRVAAAGWEQRVIFAGLVPPMQVPSLLRAMDIMALPSYQEGQGRTLVEALVCGCAIVGYDVGGIGEVCIDGQTGRLTPVGDRGKLAEALTWMLDHPDQRRQLVEQGTQHARERFDARTMTRQIEQVYHELLQGR